MLRHLLVLVAATAVVLGPAVSPASAAERWASASADPAESVCTSIAPCTFANAVNGALNGDVVTVKAGSYPVGSMSIAKAIEIRGEDAANFPVLSGTSGVATISADSGLQLTNLKITGTGGDALTMKGGSRGDRLILSSQTGDGAKLVADVATTSLKNSLVTSGGGSSAAALKLRDNGPTVGTIEVRNVTAYATNTGASGIRCETSVSTTTIVNSIVRGDVADADASGAGVKCSATNSNLRTAKSVGLTTISTIEADPALDSQYKPMAGSNTIDAGVDAVANGTLDLAGAPRVRGARTDAGAYEFQADASAPPTPPADPDPSTGGSTTGGSTSGDTTTTATPTAPRATTPEDQAPGTSLLAPAAPPQLGKSVRLDQAGKGAVLVKLPGTSRYIALGDAASLPVGTTIDTRKGAVMLSSALPGGTAQTGTFRGGIFEVRQAKSGMTDIFLRGAYTKRCTKKTVARAAAKRRKKSASRRLWASDKGGRFRTHGENSVATVRGTKWLTEDRCNGTYTRVLEGAVDVRDKRTGKVTRVRAGHGVLVRPR